MLRDYTEQYYEPSAQASDSLTADNFAKARELAAWKDKVTHGWGQVRIVAVEGDQAAATLRSERTVEVSVFLDGLDASDVVVEVLHGPVGQHDELSQPEVAEATLVEPRGDNVYLFRANFTCNTPGRYGFTARVMPDHDNLTSPQSMAMITWA